MPTSILLIVADDMGYGDFGRFNDGHVRTPHLDNLIDTGLCLTQHYSGSPVCSPARAALLTGRYPHRTGAITPQEVRGLDRIALRETTLGDAFRAAGYATGLIGKWHNGALDDRYHPNNRGFAEFCGFRGGWMDYWDWIIERDGIFQKSDGRYLTDLFTEEAVDFIRRHRREPFLLDVMYNAPHSPLHAPAELVKSYLEMDLSPGAAHTYAMIEAMDKGVGRLLETLEECGLSQDTLVMFTSDNGPAFRLRPDQVPEGMDLDVKRYNCGFKGAKGSVHEGGIRVPMILRWPAGLATGIADDHLLHFTDWLPTLLRIADAEQTGALPLDGHDVLPLLRGETPDKEPRRFWQWNVYSPLGRTNAAVRDGRWKLVRPAIPLRFVDESGPAAVQRYTELDIEYKYHPENVTDIMRDPEPERIIPDPPDPELYDIEADPLEEEDLAKAHPERTARMLAELEEWFAEVEAERQSIDDVW